MFETRAEVKAMFEQFRTVDKMTDLYTNSSLENHALIVMNALDEAITNLDDDAYLVDFLLVTGKSHQRFENFSASVFWVGRPCCSHGVMVVSGDCDGVVIVISVCIFWCAGGGGGRFD